MKNKKCGCIKKLFAMCIAILFIIGLLPFSALADDVVPKVDVQIASDGSLSDANGNNTTFDWLSSTASKPIYGSFKNKNGGITDYLQFGKDSDNDGIYEHETDSNANWLTICNSGMNNQKSTTISFWVYMEDMWNIYKSFIAYGKPTTTISGSNHWVRDAKTAEYAFADSGVNTMSLRAGVFDGNHVQGTCSNVSWKNEWCHLAFVREYDEAADSWTIKLYRNGAEVGLNSKVTINGALPDETNFIYILGGAGAARYSGIKLYNEAISTANLYTIYNNEKDKYVEYVETEMRLVSPTVDGSLTKTNGTIMLTFNSAPSEETLSGITFKEQGKDFDLFTDYVLNQKSVTFTYSGLETGKNYVLTVSGVEAINGLKMAAPVTLVYTVLEDPDLLVDVKIAPDGSFSDSVSGDQTTFGWLNTSETAHKPVYGSFMSENGKTVSYLQFGKDTNSDGVYEHETETSANWITIGNNEINNQTATTLSFWVYMEDMWNIYKSFIAYGKPKMINGSNHWVRDKQAEYAFADASDNTMYLRAGVFDGTHQQTPCTNISWKDSWCHLVFVKEYDRTENNWIVSLYKNGSKVASVTVNAALPDETDFVYLLGGSGAAKYSGIKLYNAAKEAMELYDAEKDSYVMLPNSMLLESVEPFEQLNRSGGEIIITFNNYVDESSISAINLTNSDGSPIVGKYFVSLPETKSKIVTIKYGELSGDNTYKLTIPAGIRSLNGYETTEPTEYEYSCVSDMLFSEDFEEFPEGTVAQIEGLDVISSSVADNCDDVVVYTDNATDRKYIALTAQEIVDAQGQPQTSHTGLVYSLPDSVDASEIVFEMKFRAGTIGNAETGTANKEIMRPCSEIDGAGTYTTMLTVSDDGATLSGENAYEEERNFSTVADSDGWHTIRMITDTDAKGTRYFDFYYDATNPSACCRVVKTDFNSLDVKSLLLAQVSIDPSQTGHGLAALLIDEIKVYKRTMPSVLGCNEIKAESITNEIYFATDMDLNSLENAEYYYLNDRNEKVDANFVSYDSLDRKVTVAHKDYLMFGNSYSLYIDGAISADGMPLETTAVCRFTIPPYAVQMTTPVFKNADTGMTISDLSQADSALAMFTLFNNKDTDTIVSVIALHTDITGRLKDVKCENVDVFADSENAVSIPVSSKSFTTGDTIKLFVWDDPIGGSKPVLYNPVTLSCVAAQ